MSNVIVQIGYSTTGGGVVPIASSRDRSLTKIVAQQILKELSSSDFDDILLNEIAHKERNHLMELLMTLEVM